MNFDLNEIAALLHIKEQLMKHPHLGALIAHVDAELRNRNAAATHDDLPPPVLTKDEEAVKAQQEETDRLKAEQDAEARRNEKALTPEEIQARQERDAAQARAQATQDQIRATPQPAVPQPPAQIPLQDMNNPPGTRIEDQRKPADINSDAQIPRRV